MYPGSPTFSFCLSPCDVNLGSDDWDDWVYHCWLESGPPTPSSSRDNDARGDTAPDRSDLVLYAVKSFFRRYLRRTRARTAHSHNVRPVRLSESSDMGSENLDDVEPSRPVSLPYLPCLLLGKPAAAVQRVCRRLFLGLFPAVLIILMPLAGLSCMRSGTLSVRGKQAVQGIRGTRGRRLIQGVSAVVEVCRAPVALVVVCFVTK